MPRPGRPVSVAVAVLLALVGGASCTPGVDMGSELPAGARHGVAFDPANASFEGSRPQVEPPPLEVVSATPQGRVERDRRTVELRFNQAVVALGEVARLEAPGAIELDPPVAGRSWWVTPELLRFEADAALPRASRFEVRVKSPIKAVSGVTLEAVAPFHFSTPRPTVTRSSVSNGQSQVELERAVDLFFDAPVEAAALGEALTVTATPLDAGSAEQPRPIAVKVRRWTEEEVAEHWAATTTAPPLRIEPASGRWPRGARLTLRVAAGLKTAMGPLGLEKDYTLKFETFGPLELVNASCGPEEECTAYYVELGFNNAVPAAALRRIQVIPRPRHLKIELWGGWGEDASAASMMLSGAFVPEVDYQIRVPVGIVDVHGQRLARAITHKVRFAFADESLSLHASKGVVRAAGRQHVGLVGRHVKTVNLVAEVFGVEQVAALARQGKDVFLLESWAGVKAEEGQVHRSTLKLPADPQTHFASVALDLDKLTKGARGVVRLRVEAGELFPGREDPGGDEALYHITDLMPLAVVARNQSALRVVRLSDGSPVVGAEAALVAPGHPPAALGKTDAAGMLPVAPEARWTSALASVLVRDKKDFHLVRVDDTTRGQRAWTIPGRSEPGGLKPGESMVGKVVTERDLYRPGEKVSVVGFAAIDSPYARTGLERLPSDLDVELTATDSDGRVVARTSTRTVARGRFSGQLQLPAEGRLGTYRLRAEVAGLSQRLGAHFKVKVFRTPEFSVAAVARHSELRADKSNPIEVSASYFFGGVVPIVNYENSTDCRPIYFRPDGLEGWTVGLAPPWHYGRGHMGSIRRPMPPTARHGKLQLISHPNNDKSLFTQRCTVSVAITDASDQWVGAEASYRAHPADAYVALKQPADRVEGEASSLTLRGIDTGGKRVAIEGVKVEVERQEWKPRWATKGKRRYVEEWVPRQVKLPGGCRLDLPASGADPTCRFAALRPGYHQVTVHATVDGRATRTESRFWVSSKAWRPFFAGSDPVALALDRKEIAPGDEIKVAVRAPWANAHGVLLVQRRGLRTVHPFQLTGEQANVTLTSTEDWTPGVEIEALFYVPQATSQPTIEQASANLQVSVESRRLGVKVDVAPEGKPGDLVPIDIHVKGADGRPVAGGRASVWAVDEAVLSLTGYTLPDVLATMVPGTGGGADLAHELDRILEPYVPRRYDEGAGGFGIGGTGFGAGGFGRGGTGVGGGGAAPRPRGLFETTPLFVGDVVLDASGHARVEFRLPDNLTTFRVTALASASMPRSEAPGRYGHGESSIRSRTELVVRAALPRVMRPGDTAEVAAIVNNGLGPAGEVIVEASIDGVAVELGSAASASAPVAAGGQVRLPFSLRALAAGEPAITFSARLVPDGGGETLQDAVSVKVPVRLEPTLVERVATYGSLSDDVPVTIPLVLPAGDVREDVGGLQFSVAGTLLGGVEDGAQALVHYPYGCAEQTSSRLLPLLALGELSQMFELGIGDVDGFVKVGLQRLYSMQTSSGGFGYWPGARHPHAYVSAYVTWLLHLARESGHEVPDRLFGRALDYLEQVTAEPDQDWPDTLLYYHAIRRAIAVWTLAAAGRAPTEAVAALWDGRDQMPLFSRAFVLMAMHRLDAADPRIKVLRQEMLNQIEETPSTARTRERVRWPLYTFFHSDARSDAIVLTALLQVDPDNPLVHKLVRGLMLQRRRRWRNTQENAWALISLAAFARQHEAVEPRLNARVWVEDDPLIDVALHGRLAGKEAPSASLSMKKLLAVAKGRESSPTAPLDLTLQRQGQGRMYYRIGFEYAPAGDDLPAVARGLEVERQLWSPTMNSGSATELEIGQTIALHLTVKATTDTWYVALDVPIPAGLEPIHRDLGKGHAAMGADRGRGAWVSHEEMREDRVQVFANQLAPGEHHHTIFLKATVEGRWAMPPARAEAMYEPEVFGRSVASTIVIRR